MNPNGFPENIRRGVYVTDVKPMRAVARNMDQPIIALETKPVQFTGNWGNQPVQYRLVNKPETQWLSWVGDENAQDEPVKITLKDSTEKIVTTLRDKGSYGFNRFK